MGFSRCAKRVDHSAAETTAADNAARARANADVYTTPDTGTNSAGDDSREVLLSGWNSDKASHPIDFRGLTLSPIRTGEKPQGQY